MKKKILIVIENVYSYAGTENVCDFMTESFENVEIEIVSLYGTGKPFYSFNNVKKITSLQTIKNKWQYYKGIETEFEPDYVFVIGMGRLSFIFATRFLAFRKNNKSKFIACEHVAFQSFKTHLKILKLLTLRLYDSVVVLTERDSKILSKYGINTNFIPNPIFDKKFDRSTRTKTALAVGRLEYQKGFDILLDIWSKFKVFNTDWKLIIAGGGSMEKELKDKMNELNLTDSVSFVGVVDDISKYYMNCDLLLVTSRYEGLPMVMLEAISWSMPIISFDCPTGPKELINNETNGYLVDIDSKDVFVERLRTLTEDDCLYFDMVRNVKNSNANQSVDNIKNKWNQLLG